MHFRTTQYDVIPCNCVKLCKIARRVFAVGACWQNNTGVSCNEIYSLPFIFY